MDGPQNAQQGYAGFNEIPDKDQPEDESWPPADKDWESSMQAMVAVGLAGYTGKPAPEGINLDIYRWQREVVHPRNYANMNYWELWLVSVAIYMVRSGRGGIVRADITDGPTPIMSAQELGQGLGERLHVEPQATQLVAGADGEVLVVQEEGDAFFVGGGGRCQGRSVRGWERLAKAAVGADAHR